MPVRPLPDLPGVYYCRITGEYGGRPNGQVFTFQTDSPPTVGPADSVAAGFVGVTLNAKWDNFAAVEHVVGYTGLQVQVYPLHSPLEPAFTVASGAAGGATGAIAPLQVARVVRHNVSRRGRGSQSRSYLSPVIASIVEADGITITPSFVSTLTAHWDTLIGDTLTALNAGGLGSWSYVQLGKGTTLHPTPGTYAITSSEAEPLLSTIRRRTRRNG